MGHLASPAHMARPTEEFDRIVVLLKYNGLAYDSSEDAWLPPLPKILLYPHTRVRLDKRLDHMLVWGPYGLLVRLRKQLDATRQ